MKKNIKKIALAIVMASPYTTTTAAEGRLPSLDILQSRRNALQEEYDALRNAIVDISGEGLDSIDISLGKVMSKIGYLDSVIKDLETIARIPQLEKEITDIEAQQLKLRLQQQAVEQSLSNAFIKRYTIVETAGDRTLTPTEQTNFDVLSQEIALLLIQSSLLDKEMSDLDETLNLDKRLRSKGAAVLEYMNELPPLRSDNV